MAEYQEKLMTALKEAMKAKDNKRRDTLRLLTSAFKQVQVDEQRDLSSDDELKILQKEAKKRRESVDELIKAGRAAQAEDEQYELALIESFLPKQMSRDEIAKIVQEVIEETGASSMQDMGQVMGQVMPRTGGRADGKEVSRIVKELLST